MKEELFHSLLSLAYKEDVNTGDVSSLSVFTKQDKAKAMVIAKGTGWIAGIGLLPSILAFFDDKLILKCFVKDADWVEVGQELFTIEGCTISILTLERTLLNIIQRMSGIATYTQQLINLLNDSSIKLLDTRKTTPGFRYFEKKAVEIGGGYNHRFGLYDMVMLKDNHIDFAGGITNAVTKVKIYLKENQLNLPIEVETRNLDEVKEVLSLSGVQRIMLDNFALSQIHEAVKLIDGKLEIEVSGGVNEQNLASYAHSGIDFISIGALTHSYKSLDISLKAQAC